MSISIKISVGELVDRLTILEIKAINIKDEDKLKNIEKELNYVKELYEQLDKTDGKLLIIKTDLYLINLELWEVEDKLREMEHEQRFDEDFIKLARNVYFLNDERARMKKQLNIIFKSEFIEEKSYKKY